MRSYYILLLSCIVSVKHVQTDCKKLIKAARNRNIGNIALCLILPSIMLCLRTYLDISELYLSNQNKTDEVYNSQWMNAILKMFVSIFLDALTESSLDAMGILIKLRLHHPERGKSNLILDSLSKDKNFYIENSAQNIQEALEGIPDNIGKEIASGWKIFFATSSIALYSLTRIWPKPLATIFNMPNFQSQFNKYDALAEVGLIAVSTTIGMLIAKLDKTRPTDPDLNNEVNDLIENINMVQTNGKNMPEAYRLQGKFKTQYLNDLYRAFNQPKWPLTTLPIIGYYLYKSYNVQPANRVIEFRKAIPCMQNFRMIGTIFREKAFSKPRMKNLAWQMDLLVNGKTHNETATKILKANHGNVVINIDNGFQY